MYFKQLHKQQFKYLHSFLPNSPKKQILHIAQKSCVLTAPTCSWPGLNGQLVHYSSTTTNISKLEQSLKESASAEDDLETDTKLVTQTDDDELTQRLKSFQHVVELLEFYTNNVSHMQRRHFVQTVTLLWDLYWQTPNERAKQIITDFLKKDIIPKLHAELVHMDINELSCCYLYLRKMNIPNSHTVLEHILIRALNYIEKSTDRLVPLTALSRLAVGINLEREFFTPLVCHHFVPHLERHILECTSVEQAHLLAICMFQLQSLIDAGLMAVYKERIGLLLRNRQLSSDTPKTLLKVLHMLNAPLWSAQNVQYIREILLALTPCLLQMEPVDLKMVCRTFLHHQEPAMLIQPLKQATEALLQTEETPDALSCAVPFMRPQQRDGYIALFKQLLKDKANCQPNANGHFFSILRALKVADIRLCDAYWSNVVEELNVSAEEQSQLRFLRHCQRYMNFNNNLGGTYRHAEVERKLVQMAMYAIEYDVAGRIPAKFARLAAFVVAYGHTPLAWKKFPNLLLSKILAMAEQFSITDCFIISRGMQIALELRFRYHVPALLGMQLSTIDSILISCAERYLRQEQELNANDLNAIVRTLSHRKSLKNSVVYTKTLQRYKQLDCNKLNSRAVRDMAYNFNASNFFVPNVLESMFAYLEQNNEHVTGDTVEKVLTCAYNLGYTPQSTEVLHEAANVLLRDFDYMSGLALVQACLALCFYKTIPDELINKVFCVKFIQRVEDEIQICYSKATYPERVLNLVMQLNRTVCLDFPEANVPWFQQNYVEAQLSKKPILQNKFSADVKRLLKELLKDENYFRCNHTTPYGYQIDFVIHFDRDRKPLPAPPEETTMLDRITKVAILLMKLDSFCENDITALRGPESLKIKHLEMMGYKVLHINENDWNSKYLNSPGAKSNYLKCLLQISH